MAARVLSARRLRKQLEEAAVPGENGTAAPAATKAKKAPVKRKPRAKKAPPRMYARWGVFDGGMKQVAIFGYSERPAADEKLAELLARKKGTYFLQIVKEPMPEPVAAEAVSPA